MHHLVRVASAANAGRICAIYNPYVSTAATTSFEEQAVGEAEMAHCMAELDASGLPWLLIEADGEAVS